MLVFQKGVISLRGQSQAFFSSNLTTLHLCCALTGKLVFQNSLPHTIASRPTLGVHSVCCYMLCVYQRKVNVSLSERCDKPERAITNMFLIQPHHIASDMTYEGQNTGLKLISPV